MFQEPSMYHDREAAGRALARRLINDTGYSKMDPIVIAVPKNSISVARVLADELQCELDLCLIQRIPSLMDPEKTLAAVTENGDVIFDDDSAVGMFQNYVKEQRLVKVKQLRDTRGMYSRHLPTLANFSSSHRGRTVILVDDGVMTGTTMRAAIQFVRTMYKPAKIVVAVPICSQAALAKLQDAADDCIVLYSPKRNFHSLNEFYVKSPSLTDLDVISALSERNEERAEERESRVLSSRGRSSSSSHSGVSHPLLVEYDDDESVFENPACTPRESRESDLWTGHRKYGRSLSMLSSTSDSMALSKSFDD